MGKTLYGLMVLSLALTAWADDGRSLEDGNKPVTSD